MCAPMAVVVHETDLTEASFVDNDGNVSGSAPSVDSNVGCTRVTIHSSKSCAGGVCPNYNPFPEQFVEKFAPNTTDVTRMNTGTT